MKQKEFFEHFKHLFNDVINTLKIAAGEYAHVETEDDNIFDNFTRHAKNLGLDKKQIWAVYFNKHVDGINNYIKTAGEGEQREDIRGRIIDSISYLCLLHGMITEDKKDITKMHEK